MSVCVPPLPLAGLPLSKSGVKRHVDEASHLWDYVDSSEDRVVPSGSVHHGYKLNSAGFAGGVFGMLKSTHADFSWRTLRRCCKYEQAYVLT